MFHPDAGGFPRWRRSLPGIGASDGSVVDGKGGQRSQAGHGRTKFPGGNRPARRRGGGGCSGFQYSLGFDNATDEVKDEVMDQHGIKVAVDKRSMLYLDGATVDFHDGLDKRGFTFVNPNAVKSCGCGSSFSA